MCCSMYFHGHLKIFHFLSQIIIFSASFVFAQKIVGFVALSRIVFVRYATFIEVESAIVVHFFSAPFVIAQKVVGFVSSL